jgi:hypothetical protein
MEIVINRCYGGFKLSPEALKRIAEIQGRACHFFCWDGERYIEWNSESLLDCLAFDIGDPNGCIARGEPLERHYIFDEANRTDSALVQAVKELGEKANGLCADLRIIEVPDDVEWEIDDYDDSGMEHVFDRNRVWGREE